MKRVIDGKVYNTDTGTYLCEVRCTAESSRDFGYEDTDLYRSPKGAYFLSGKGGPMTRWAVSVGNNGRTGGSGIQLVDADEAREIMESAGCDEDDLVEAGFTLEEG